MLVYNYETEDGTLYHHGIKGMRWGVRRYQNSSDKRRTKAQAVGVLAGSAAAIVGYSYAAAKFDLY